MGAATPAPDQRAPARLAEIVAALSLGTDLGLGQPMEHMIRTSMLALRLADELGLSEDERSEVYYAGMLAWVGCHTDAYEQAKWFGDDLTLKREGYGVDLTRLRPSLVFLARRAGGPGRPLLDRAMRSVRFLGGGFNDMSVMLVNHYLTTAELAQRLGLSDDVRASLGQTYERWDGRNTPLGLRGAEIRLPARVVAVADAAEAFHRIGGVAAATAVARERSGTQLDPALVSLLCDRADLLLAGLDGLGWDAVIRAEPALARALDDEQLEDVLSAVGAFADLKSPWRIGHSAAVSHLASAAAGHLGLPPADITAVRRAAAIQDIGILGVPNTIWDKPDRLTAVERERVRLHPYLCDRMLQSSPALAPLGALAGLHQERMDGSGYPRGLAGSAITMGGRILAAADTYQAMREPRPHRPALASTEAAAHLRAEVSAGRLDGDAAESVLQAAGHRARRPGRWPAGLTTREVQVLRLLVRGMPNRAIALRLTISPKTVNRHVENIYAKTAAHSRAQVAVFAITHGLLPE